ncbi:hypothetical protein ONZ45_g3392 [Pleurotus djamor]|nr:hypothetical protein ONZ45_g3392 [Pleurotus djamor]
MTSHRPHTVYDNASLRLRASGQRTFRVEQSFSDTIVPKHAVKDRMGNWIATDAGGKQVVSKSVRKTAKRKRPVDDDGEYIDVNPEGASSSQAAGVAKPARPRRRQKTQHDVEFLTQKAVEEATEDSEFLPVPSSDLLKCIHHFASAYYAEKGQLTNLAQQYRMERKARKAARKNKTEESTEDHAANDNEDGQPTPAPREKVTRRRDMYKAMDGSALMAIGMIIQEYVAFLVTPQIPEDWDDEPSDYQPHIENPPETTEPTEANGDDVEEQADETAPETEPLVEMNG